MSLTQEYLKRILAYDPISGNWTWLLGARAGRRAGSNRPDGYRHISINRGSYLEHRLAWLYMIGEWPIQIDHKNGCREDSSWENLRNATHSQNKMHTATQVNNTSGYKGVHLDSRRGKYIASIKKDNQIYFLGYFEEAEEASKAYVKAALELHGEFAQLS